MAVVLKFQSTGAIPGNAEPVHMQGASLTIGRGQENDLVLPDPDRVLSKRHCAIEDHNGNVIVVDISTNGTFLNYGKLPLGTTPTPLNDGDILCVGPYEILVSIPQPDRNDRLADPLEDAPVSHGFADRAPSQDDLLDAPGDGGDFLDDLLSGRDELKGPRGVEREEPDEDGLLPPLIEWDIGSTHPASRMEDVGCRLETFRARRRHSAADRRQTATDEPQCAPLRQPVARALPPAGTRGGRAPQLARRARTRRRREGVRGTPQDAQGRSR